MESGICSFLFVSFHCHLSSIGILVHTQNYYCYCYYYTITATTFFRVCLFVCLLLVPKVTSHKKQQGVVVRHYSVSYSFCVCVFVFVGGGKLTVTDSDRDSDSE